LKVARGTALLIGERDALALTGRSERIPWGKQRVVFHVET